MKHHFDACPDCGSGPMVSWVVPRLRFGDCGQRGQHGVANGKMISLLREHHRHHEILYFLRQIYKQPPPDLDWYLVVDNYVTLKRGKVMAWMARHPRFQMHITLTHSSWLNQVERWLALITERAVCRSTFTGMRELKPQSICSCSATTPTRRSVFRWVRNC